MPSISSGVTAKLLVVFSAQVNASAYSFICFIIDTKPFARVGDRFAHAYAVDEV